MSGLDSLIAKSLDVIIKENLGEITLQKVEQRIFEKFGINLTQAIEDFPKLDSILREFFGDGAEGLERKFIGSLVTLEQSKKSDQEWITIEDKNLSTKILRSFGDDDKNKILGATFSESKVVSEILEICKIPQTSGYRKVNQLIEDGLLITDGIMTTYDGKIVNKYKSLFENVQIDIVKNNVIVRALLSNQSVKNSSVIKVVCR